MTIAPGDLSGPRSADRAGEPSAERSGAAGSLVPSALVTLARSGDRAAADELARRFVRPAYLLALQLLGNPEDARDASQNALMSFFSRLDRLEPGRPVRPWLLTIVRNASLDLMRRRTVRRSDSLDERREEFGAEVIDRHADPEADSRRSELRRDLWCALGRLKPKEREILVLRDYQDLTYAEIANVLSIPVGTVMSRLHRARRSLRSQLEADYGPGGFGSRSRGSTEHEHDRRGGDHG